MEKKHILGMAALATMTLSANESKADFYEAQDPKQSVWQGELQTRGEYNYKKSDVNNILAIGLKGYATPFYVATHFDNNLNGLVDELSFEGGGFFSPTDTLSFLTTTRYTRTLSPNKEYLGLWLRTTVLEIEKGFTFDAGMGYDYDLDDFTQRAGKAGDHISLQATLGNHIGKHWLVGVEDVGEFYLLRDNAYSVQIKPLVRYNTKEWSLTGFTGFLEHTGNGNLRAVVVYGLSLNIGWIIQNK